MFFGGKYVSTREAKKNELKETFRYCNFVKKKL